MRRVMNFASAVALLSATACAVLDPQAVAGQEPRISDDPQGPTSSGGDGPPPGTSDGWEVSARVGVLTMPAYTGSDEYQVWAVPEVNVKRGEFFFSFFEGTGYNLMNDGTWRAGPIVKYQFGRDEDGDNPLRIGGPVTDDLRGLGDVDDTIELGGFAEYRAGSLVGKVEVRQGIGGHEGLIGELELKSQHMVNVFGKHSFLSFGPELTLADSTYNSSYFDVTAAQSAASGLSQYEADGGFLSAGLGAALAVPFTERVSLVGFGSYSRLLGDAADSSLVQARGSEDQFMAGFFLSYRF